MNEMIQEVQMEINKLEKIMLIIDDFLHNAPEGCLKWQHKGEKIYYYQQFKEMKNNKNKWKRKYITKENISLAKLLAKKHYYCSVVNILDTISYRFFQGTSIYAY